MGARSLENDVDRESRRFLGDPADLGDADGGSSGFPTLLEHPDILGSLEREVVTRGLRMVRDGVDDRRLDAWADLETRGCVPPSWMLPILKEDRAHLAGRLAVTGWGDRELAPTERAPGDRFPGDRRRLARVVCALLAAVLRAHRADRDPSSSSSSAQPETWVPGGDRSPPRESPAPSLYIPIPRRICYCDPQDGESHWCDWSPPLEWSLPVVAQSYAGIQIRVDLAEATENPQD